MCNDWADAWRIFYVVLVKILIETYLKYLISTIYTNLSYKSTFNS